MDFKFTDGQLMLQKVAKDFAEEIIEPRAEEIDRTGEFPRDIFDKMCEVGFAGIGTPVEYGGSGGNDIDKVLVVSEVAQRDASCAAILSIHTIFASVLMKFGTEEQKKKYLPETTNGGALGAFALTEPNAGSDAGSAKTTAILDEETGEYILNGTKCFISGGSQAKNLLIFALTDPSKGTKGLSCILVEKDTPGFSVGKIEDKMGIHGSETAEFQKRILSEKKVRASKLQ